MGKNTIDEKRLLDFMIVTECAKALRWEQEQTDRLVAIHLNYDDGNPAVHLSNDGLRQLAKPDEWMWIHLGRFPKCHRYPWQAGITENDILFFSLFTNEGKIEMESSKQRPIIPPPEEDSFEKHPRGKPDIPIIYETIAFPDKQ